MKAFTQVTGIVAPLDRANVDTDQIIPKQFLKSIQRTGFGPNLFDEWRYLDQGFPGQDYTQRPLNKDFVLNQEPYTQAKILLTRQNFGCGSSREHAPWALDDFGFRCIIAPSFADIFYNNCFKNGILPIQLTEEQVENLFHLVTENKGFTFTVDLESQTIKAGDESQSHLLDEIKFDIPAPRKSSLLKGLDEIGETLVHSDAIRAFEEKYHSANPWL